MKRFLLTPLLAIASLTAADSMREAKIEGEKLGRIGNRAAVEQAKAINQGDFRPPSTPEFDSEIAAKRIQEQNIPQTDTLDFLISQEVQGNVWQLNPEEYLFKRSDGIVDRYEDAFVDISTIENSGKYTVQTCREAGAPYPLSLYRTLDLEVLHEPEAQEEITRCLGHQRTQKFWFKSDAEAWISKQTAKLAIQPDIKTSTSRISDGGPFSKYTAALSWEHHDNVSNCDHKEKQLTIKPERWEEKGERWIYDDPALAEQAKGVDCRLIGHECLDALPRIIQGRQVCKPCWRERLNFLYSYPQTKLCSALRERNCTEVGRQCLVDGAHGCALWEVSYRCFGSLSLRSTDHPREVYGLAAEEWELEYDSNESFSDVATKLALFQDLKAELQAQDVLDATKVQLFAGRVMSCARNIADKVLYDCCFSFGGLATELKLSQCSAQEIALGEMRERGLCHYIGKHEEKFLDLWKSRDEHVFCCFSSKLARVFHEGAREQLHMLWGSPEEPHCRGLYLAELQNVDFTKLNLREAYDQLSQDLEQRLQNKLKSVEGHLKDRLRGEDENAST